MSNPGDGRSRRAKEKRERRRREVLRVALEVFSDKGYHKTRVSDILDAAGIARGTFYLYFDSKQAIFHETLDLVLLEIRSSVVGVDLDPGAPPLRDQLLVTMRRVLQKFQENRAIGSVVLREAIGLDDEVDQKLDEFYRQLHQWLAESLQNGVLLGFLRELDTSTVAWCIVGSVKEVLSRMIDADPTLPPDPDALAATLLDHHLSGVESRS